MAGATRAGQDGPRALVVGGSMSGLFAGLLLRRRGFRVEIFERVEGELAGRGAGIVAQPPMFAALDALGIATAGLGVESTRRRAWDAGGRLIHETECPQTLTSWERVYRLLRDAFPPERYRRGAGVTAVEQTAGAAVAHLSDGSRAEADLLVAADGIRSTVRRQLLPELAPLYAGYVAWRALVPEGELPPEVRREVFPYMSFCLPPGEQFLTYPVAGPDDDLRPGHRRLNMVWYRPAEEATELQRLLTDERGVAHAVSIPPPLIRRAAVEDMRAAAERLIAPQLRAVVRRIAEPILQPIYDLETPRMAFGRIAVIGDAAFVARPHVGAGVSKAADDARALADAVAGGDVEPGLRRFEAERLPVGRRIVARARRLGAYLQASQSAEERTHSQRHGTARAVLAETALVDFLEA